MQDILCISLQLLNVLSIYHHTIYGNIFFLLKDLLRQTFKCKTNNAGWKNSSVRVLFLYIFFLWIHYMISQNYPIEQVFSNHLLVFANNVSFKNNVSFIHRIIWLFRIFIHTALFNNVKRNNVWKIIFLRRLPFIYYNVF